MVNSYTPLEPSIAESLNPGGQAPTYNPADLSFFTSVSFLYTLSFSLIVMGAFYRYGIAGVLRMQASEKGIRDSNDIMKKTTLGLLGVFSLFLLLSLVNKDMLTGDVGLSALKTAGGTASPAPAVPKTGAPAGVNNPPIPKNNDDPTRWGAIADDARVRTRLKQSGITVNNNVCVTPTSRGCTTVGGLPEESISMVEKVKSACGSASIIISGGTEDGHSSHGPGKRPVDISFNGAGSEECIRGFPKSSRVPKRGNGAPLCYPNKVYENFGYVFCDEEASARHWHIF